MKVEQEAIYWGVELDKSGYRGNLLAATSVSSFVATYCQAGIPAFLNAFLTHSLNAYTLAPTYVSLHSFRGFHGNWAIATNRHHVYGQTR